MKKREFILFIVLFLGMFIFSSIPIELFNINYSKFSTTMKIIYNLACDFVFMFIMFLIYRKELTKSFKEFIKKHNKYIKKYFPYYLMGLCVMVISNIIISLFISGATANNEIAIRQKASLYPIYMLISAGICAPFMEEIIFRKCIKDMFIMDKKNTYLKYAYIIVSGFVFAFVHIWGNSSSILDYAYIVPYMGVGIAFSYIYYDSDNIFSSMEFHSLHNIVALVIFLVRSML